MLIRLTFLLLLTALPVQAMTPTVQVREPETMVRSAPEGKVLAIANRGTHMLVLDQRGRWLRVRLSGWVYRPLPPAKPQTATEEEQAEPAPKPPVELLNKTMVFLPQDYHRQTTPHRAHALVTLSFVNNSQELLTAIRYHLILRDAAGRAIVDKDYDSELIAAEDGSGLQPVRLLWLEQGGPAGEIYRSLKNAALKGGITMDVTLQAAYFPETGELELQKPEPDPDPAATPTPSPAPSP